MFYIIYKQQVHTNIHKQMHLYAINIYNYIIVRPHAIGNYMHIYIYIVYIRQI